MPRTAIPTEAIDWLAVWSGVCGLVLAHDAALRADDLDAALGLGLLDAQPCPTCADACTARLVAARDERRFALAARDRFLARAARLARRKTEREAARTPPPSPAAMKAAALPPAAADVLARALAKAAARKP